MAKKTSRSQRVPPLVWQAIAVAAVVVTVGAVLLAARTKSSPGGNAAGVKADGSPAPAVALPATTGATVDLATYRGKRDVLLYFYEHAG